MREVLLDHEVLSITRNVSPQAAQDLFLTSFKWIVDL